MDNSNSNDFQVLQKETKSLERLINESLNASIGIIPLLYTLYSVVAPRYLWKAFNLDMIGTYVPSSVSLSSYVNTAASFIY